MADTTADLARGWLERFDNLYAGLDAGEGDPVHSARIQAQEFLKVGPKTSDPFTIAGMMIDALPFDERAVNLALPWLEEYLRELRRLQDDA